MNSRSAAPQNRTLALTDDEVEFYRHGLLHIESPLKVAQLLNRTVHQDIMDCIHHLPDAFVDLVVADPPYNLDKQFNGRRYNAVSLDEYATWLDEWLSALHRILKPTATVYICGDWRSSTAIHRVAERHFHVRNRITWEREKGRGAKANWKNCSEDIWFCTVSSQYTFNAEAVKLRRDVIAPYRTPDGKPKDWVDDEDGRTRLTAASNLWTDVTVPFWSMPENTEHPTQKPEKLVAKLMLASSQPGDIVFDPFLGSGTTSVVAKKLGRQYVGIEVDERYCCIAEKRLHLTTFADPIQGYEEGVFLERNTRSRAQRRAAPYAGQSLFSK